MSEKPPCWACVFDSEPEHTCDREPHPGYRGAF